MRNMRTLTGVMITLSAAFALGCAPETPQIDQQAIEADVNAWLQTFWGAWAEGGAGFDRGIAMFDDHPGFFMASDGASWRSLAATDAAFRPVFETIESQTFDMEPALIAVLGPDLVHVSLAGTYVQNGLDGTSVGPNPFVGTMVLVRIGGVWKARFYHQSEPNAASTDAG